MANGWCKFQILCFCSKLWFIIQHRDWKCWLLHWFWDLNANVRFLVRYLHSKMWFVHLYCNTNLFCEIRSNPYLEVPTSTKAILWCCCCIEFIVPDILFCSMFQEWPVEDTEENVWFSSKLHDRVHQSKNLKNDEIRRSNCFLGNVQIPETILWTMRRNNLLILALVWNEWNNCATDWLLRLW